MSVTAQCSGTLEGTAHPSYFEAVVRSYPNARIVLAHMGPGGGKDVVARLTSTYANVFADTSSWLGQVNSVPNPAVPTARSFTPAEAVELFRRIGTDRILYASNYPLTDSREFVEKLRLLPFTDDERLQIFFQNAQRVHGGLGAGVSVS